MSACCDQVRQTRRKLPRLHQAGINPTSISGGVTNYYFSNGDATVHGGLGGSGNQFILSSGTATVYGSSGTFGPGFIASNSYILSNGVYDSITFC